MSTYTLDISNQAKEDIRFHKKAGNKAIINKIIILLKEIANDPFKGTGKPEQLKHSLNGYWSRRINREHRLIYQVGEETISVVSARGHYD
jgi:toxin YoeB